MWIGVPFGNIDMNVLNMIRGTVLACGAMAVTTTAQAQEFSWDMPNVFSRSSSDGTADTVFSELLAEKSGGRIKIVHHFDGSLGYKGVDHLEAVQDGGVPIARHALSYYGGYDATFLL